MPKLNNQLYNMAINVFKKIKKEDEKEVEKEEAKMTKEKKEPELIKKTSGPYGILKQPHMTEKASRIVSENKYVFLVNPKATKPEVKKEVARRYGVKVTKVNMTRKTKRARRWSYRLQRPSVVKKAIVTLAKGEKLEIT
jgi:large subunit ribosomal protein L23